MHHEDTGGFRMKRSFITLLIFLLLIDVAPINRNHLVVFAEGLTETVNQQQEVPDGFVGIYSISDLNDIRNDLNGRYILMSNLDLSAATASGGNFDNNGQGWQPIGTKETPFTGELNGNGYEISGMRIDLTSDQEIYAGLFGYSEQAIFQNIKMVNTHISVNNTSIYSDSSKTYAGSIVGFMNDSSEIKNSCHSGSIQATSIYDSYAGGLAGFGRKSTILSSHNNGDIEAKGAGGLVGAMEYDPSKIEGSFNTGKITADKNAGGITSFFSGEVIQNSYNTGEVKGNQYAGGISASLTSSSIKNAENTGNITGYRYSGGIIASMSGSTIETSRNLGEVITTSSSISDVGGIVGYMSRSVIDKSYNLGFVSGYSAGGIAGTLTNSTIQETYNVGNVDGSGLYGGGIAAMNYYNSTIRNSFNLGSVFGRYIVGGIVGDNFAVIENTYNTGVVSYPRYSFTHHGGIAGESEGTHSNNYFLNNIYDGVGTGSDSGTILVSFDELLDPATFNGFDFDTTWTTEGNLNFQFPELIALPITDVEEEDRRIVVVSQPDKTSYMEGEELDITGVALSLQTSFGNTSDIAITSDMISGYEPNKPGYQQITISYNGFKAYFTVNVIEKDRTPPAEVSDFQVVKTNTDSITISYTHPTDGDYDHANIYFNSEFVGELESTTTEYTFDGLTSNTRYPITIKTVDSNGNESEGLSLSPATEKSYADIMVDKIYEIMERLRTAFETVKLWDLDTAEEGKEYVADNVREELEQQLESYKRSIGLKDLTSVSPSLLEMDPDNALRIDFTLPFDSSTIVKNENIFIRHNGEFVDDVDFLISADVKTVYIFAPSEGYTEGEYSLYIDTTVKSKDGEPLKNPIVVKFEF